MLLPMVLSSSSLLLLLSCPATILFDFLVAACSLTGFILCNPNSLHCFPVVLSFLQRSRPRRQARSPQLPWRLPGRTFMQVGTPHSPLQFTHGASPHRPEIRFHATVRTVPLSSIRRHCYCTLLHYTALYCTGLCCAALHCATLHSTALRCTALHCPALHCAALRCTALHCAALRCTALHCTVLYCTVLYLTPATKPS